MSKNPFLAVDQKLVGDVYTSREAMDNLTVLCDEFGSRFGGTPEEKQAADFIQARLEAYGLHNVRLEPFEYPGWRRGQVSLTITSPIQRPLPCITLPHAPAADLQGEVIDLGEGSADDFERHQAAIKGKIVMVDSTARPRGMHRWVHRNEKLGMALLAEAIGFIFVNHYPAFGEATGGIGHGGMAAIPGISLSKENGAYLSRLIKRQDPVSVQWRSSDVNEPMTSWNVVGELPGSAEQPQLVILGCHYDGHDIAQGAQDPASGAVAVMEAARVLAKYAGILPHTIRFCLWGVEEIGLLGSRTYVQQHLAEMDSIRFYLNMDGAGAIPLKDIVLNEWPDLEALFGGWAAEMALDFVVGQSVHAHSDHYPFLLAGVPTGGMEAVRDTSSGRGYGHTAHDTLDKVKLAHLQEAAGMGARLALRLASVPDDQWPVSRRSPETVAEMLANNWEYAESDAVMRQVTTTIYPGRGEW